MPSVPLNQRSKIVTIFFCSVLFMYNQTHAQCTASGPRNPGTAKDSSYPGSDFAFSSPNNTFTSNGSYSSAGSIASLISGQTDYLKVTNFGFTIPTSATICGIQVDVEKSAAALLGLGSITDNNARILQGNTAGTDVPNAGAWPTTDTYISYGGSNQLWGLSWTAADINSSNFGFLFSANIIGFFNGIITVLPIAQVDNIRITVYYSVVLPIKLTKFDITGNKYNNTVLQWKAGEQNEPVKYDVERSPNGTMWETLIHNVQSDGSGQSFTYTDTKPLPGQSYYRLKMITIAGVESYSETKSFLSAPGRVIKCYPNPAVSYVQIQGVASGEQMQLTDIYGQRIKTVPTEVNSDPFRIDVSQLQPGVYFITIGNTIMKFRRN